MKIAYVKWLDSRHTEGPVSRFAADGYRALVMDSGGLLLTSDDECVRIARSSWEGEADGRTTVDYILVIPRAYVLEMRVFDVEAVKPAEDSVAAESVTDGIRKPLV